MATASSFRTNVDTMQSASQRVEEVADAVDAALRNLDSRIQPVVGTWSSDTSTAYIQLHQRWTEQARRLRLVLVDIAAGIRQNASNYGTNESELTAAVTRMSGQLG
jgi:WXG100 family type VII secretion target